VPLKNTATTTAPRRIRRNENVRLRFAGVIGADTRL
jgi:hypothetical protein